MKKLSIEEKRLDTDLWIILLTTLGVFFCYKIMGKQIIDFLKDNHVSLVSKLFINAIFQFGIAGLGITIVCIWRREKFTDYGLRKKNIFQAIVSTIICFIPYIIYVLLSSKFNGYHPFGSLNIQEIAKSGIPFSIIGLLLIFAIWGFFEGFNYAVISEKINKRYPSNNQWLDYGAITCAIICILLHSFDLSFLGIIEMITVFIGIYGMLIVTKRTENAWGCVFAFCFIWNAL